MIDIKAEKIHAALAPDLGGAVMSLRYGNRDVFRQASSVEAVAADPREAACYPCLPWFGRLYGGLDFAGRHYDLAPTLPACDPEHALHGHGWVNRWQVIEHLQSRLTCSFDYAPKPHGFPFAFSARQDFTVTETAFMATLTLINSGGEDMPGGLGLHPFFPCNADTRLNVVERPATYPLPGKLKTPELIDHSGPISGDAIDYTINRWDGEAEISHDGMRIEIRSNARLLHLYSPEDAGFYCAEPVSHCPGSFGGDILAPGEAMTLTLALTLRE